jgi:hypothetical protein
LLEVGALVLAVSVGDVGGFFSGKTVVVVPPDVDTGGIKTALGGVEIEDGGRSESELDKENIPVFHGAECLFKFVDPLFQNLDAIPERENEIRDGFGVSLGQSDEFVTIPSLHDESTQRRYLSFLKDLSSRHKQTLFQNIK